MKIKVLQFSLAASMGGRSRYILDIWKYINHEEFQFDFVTFANQLPIEEELKKQGCKVFHFPCYPKENLKLFINTWKRILDENYDIIHLNTSFWDGFWLEEYAEGRTSKIIVHAHNTGIGKNVQDDKREIILQKHYELRKNLDFNKITECWACSKAAASWLFGERIPKEKLFITYPTIDAKEFLYSEEIRRQYRERMGINAEYIVGSVGRLVYQKNYSFILEAFSEEFKGDEEVKLLIIGRGEQEKELRKLSKKLDIEKQLVMLNDVENIIPYYYVMDLFVLPSLYEGFPKVVVEAAATGLKCICSDTITEEVEAIQGIIRLPLEKEEWKSTLKKQRLMPNENRMIAVEMIENCGFDLRSEVIRIEQKYRENLHEKDKEDLK